MRTAGPLLLLAVTSPIAHADDQQTLIKQITALDDRAKAAYADGDFAKMKEQLLKAKVHVSGAVAMSYVTITSIPTIETALGPVIIAHRGHVGGTFAFDGRTETWNETTTDRRLAEKWSDVKRGAPHAKNIFSTSVDSIDVLDAIVNGVTGTFVFSL